MINITILIDDTDMDLVSLYDVVIAAKLDRAYKLNKDYASKRYTNYKVGKEITMRNEIKRTNMHKNYKEKGAIRAQRMWF